MDSIFRKEVADPLSLEWFSFTWREKYKHNKAFGHFDSIPTDNSYQASKPFFKEQGPNLFAASYSLYATSDNYARFLMAITQRALLKAETYEEFLRLQTKMPRFPATDMHRSLFAFIKPAPDGWRYFHTGDNGDFQAWTHLYPDQGFGIVILTNGNQLFSSGLAERLLVFLQESVGNQD